MLNRTPSLGPASSALLVICKLTIAVLLVEQIVYFTLGVEDKSLLSSLDQILESPNLKFVVCGQLAIAAVLLTSGIYSRVITVWVWLMVISLTSFHLQNEAIVTGFWAVRVLLVLVASAPILLFTEAKQSKRLPTRRAGIRG